MVAKALKLDGCARHSKPKLIYFGSELVCVFCYREKRKEQDLKAEARLKIHEPPEKEPTAIKDKSL